MQSLALPKNVLDFQYLLFQKEGDSKATCRKIEAKFPTFTPSKNYGMCGRNVLFFCAKPGTQPLKYF